VAEHSSGSLVKVLIPNVNPQQTGTGQAPPVVYDTPITEQPAEPHMIMCAAVVALGGRETNPPDFTFSVHQDRPE